MQSSVRFPFPILSNSSLFRLKTITTTTTSYDLPPTTKPVSIADPSALRNQLALNSLNLRINKETYAPNPLNYINGIYSLLFKHLYNLDLINYEFIVISCGHTVGTPSNPLPCEIAIQVFTLAQGITRSFHRFIDPSPPSRYSFPLHKQYSYIP